MLEQTKQTEEAPKPENRLRILFQAGQKRLEAFFFPHAAVGFHGSALAARHVDFKGDVFPAVPPADQRGEG